MASNRTLNQVSKLIGLQNAILLTRRYGGRDFTVPSREKLTDTHPLVLAIGQAPAYAMSERFGGEKIKLPPEVNALLLLRNQEIVRRFYGDGQVESETAESIRALSIDYGLDRALIQRIVDAAGFRDLRLSRSVKFS